MGLMSIVRKLKLLHREADLQSSEKRHLFKPLISIIRNRRYLDVWKPNDALSNDASMNNLLDNESFRNFFKEGDFLIMTEDSETHSMSLNVMDPDTKCWHIYLIGKNNLPGKIQKSDKNALCGRSGYKET